MAYTPAEAEELVWTRGFIPAKWIAVQPPPEHERCFSSMSLQSQIWPQGLLRDNGFASAMQ
eukprot:8145532-Pyramimonas_sp.AAC.1